MDSFAEHATSSGSELLLNTVTEIQKTDSGFIVKTPSKDYTSRFVILATGNTYKKLGVPGEAEFL
jgi:thioredoxin reductase (NADPH)